MSKIQQTRTHSTDHVAENLAPVKSAIRKFQSLRKLYAWLLETAGEIFGREHRAALVTGIGIGAMIELLILVALK